MYFFLIETVTTYINKIEYNAKPYITVGCVWERCILTQ